MATVLIAGTAGFVVDAGLNAVGFLEPGAVGIAAASGALGVKKGIDARLAQKRELKARQGNRNDEIERAEKLAELLNEEKYQDLGQRLERELELFNSNITDIDSFKTNIDEIIKEYRERN